MPYQEKSNFISLITSLFIGTPYLLYVLFRYNALNVSGSEELSFWATSFLLLIPVRIVIEIILHIVLAITTAIITQKDDIDDTTDERDRLIELKSTRNSAYTFYIGFVLAIISLAIFKTAGSFFYLYSHLLKAHSLL